MNEKEAKSLLNQWETLVLSGLSGKHPLRPSTQARKPPARYDIETGISSGGRYSRAFLTVHGGRHSHSSRSLAFNVGANRLGFTINFPGAGAVPIKGNRNTVIKLFIELVDSDLNALQA